VVDRLGDRVEGVALDVADDTAVASVFDEVGAFDHLVLTAAYVPSGTLSELDPDEVRRAFEVKFWGYYRAIRHAADQLPDDGSGSITAVSGNAGVKPAPSFFAVGVVNAAVESLVRYAAVELQPVRVNAVSPGTVDTFDMDPETKRGLAASLPTGRVGEPEDVAAAIVSLATNPYATGSVPRLDGGGLLT
jgi:NAD(P)-dependent dehydrogenase (short-subunit alcohol dehydrogenase family)